MVWPQRAKPIESICPTANGRHHRDQVDQVPRLCKAKAVALCSLKPQQYHRTFLTMPHLNLQHGTDTGLIKINARQIQGKPAIHQREKGQPYTLCHTYVHLPGTNAPQMNHAPGRILPKAQPRFREFNRGLMGTTWFHGIWRLDYKFGFFPVRDTRISNNLAKPPGRIWHSASCVPIFR